MDPLGQHFILLVNNFIWRYDFWHLTCLVVWLGGLICSFWRLGFLALELNLFIPLLSVPEWRLDIICFGFLSVWAGCFPPLTPKIQNNPPRSRRELSWTEITGSLDGIFAQRYFDCLEKLENDHVRTGLRLSMRIDFRENGRLFARCVCFTRVQATWRNSMALNELENFQFGRYKSCEKSVDQVVCHFALELITKNTPLGVPHPRNFSHF